MLTMEAYGYGFADTDFYFPLSEIAETGPEFAPSSVPEGWAATTYDVWTAWNPRDVVKSDEGWKVHVSTRLDRAQHVLDTSIPGVSLPRGVAIAAVLAALRVTRSFQHRISPVSAAGGDGAGGVSPEYQVCRLLPAKSRVRAVSW